MFFAEITSDPHPSCRSNYIGIGARRKNGDRVRIFGECRRQVFAIKRLLMKLSRHSGLPLKDHADFIGLNVERTIAATNEELLDCLSSVPDPYAEVDLNAAMTAAIRDMRICNRVLAQDPTIEQLWVVCDSIYDWGLFWRCNHPNPTKRDWFAAEIAKHQSLITEARERLERRNADGQAN